MTSCIVLNIISVFVLDTNTNARAIQLDCLTPGSNESFLVYELQAEDKQVELVSYDHKTKQYTARISKWVFY